MSESMILRNARVVDPANQIDEVRDIGIVDGRFADPAGIRLHPTKSSVYNLKGSTIVPGLVDLHVHFREPGFEYKEDLASGTAAAAAGGFTTVVLMPNTNPAMDRLERIEELQRGIAAKASVTCLISACLTVDRAGVELSDLPGLAASGQIVAFSDDGNCVQDRELMLRAGKLAAAAKLPILDHCEDEGCMQQGVLRGGAVAERLQLPGMPGETESNIVRRNVELARETGAHFHLQHLSYRQSVELLRAARREGLAVSAEASPHHLTLTVDEVPMLGTNSKMNPPLGTRDDREALWEALADGTIETIATDHAPHAPHEKARGIQQAPFGIIGLETALPLSLTALYHTGILGLSELIAKLTCNPARIIHRDAGTLTFGRAADLAILDLDRSYAIDILRSRSRSLNSPFHRRQVTGKVVGTIRAGRWVHRQL